MTANDNNNCALALAHFAAEYARVAAQLPGQNLPWLAAARVAAETALHAHGLPTSRDEAWKYTRITAERLCKFTVKTNAGTDAASAAAMLAELNLPRTDYQLVFVDGQFAADLSTIATLPPGNQLTSLARALQAEDAIVATHLNQLNAQAPHAFKHLNTLFLQDGAFIYLAPGSQLQPPIHLVFIATAQSTAGMTTLRNLIVAAADSAATVIEHYVSATTEAYSTNSITELFLAPAAQLTHYKVQRESARALHVATLAVAQAQRSTFTSHTFALGSALARSDIDVDLNAEHATCHLNGVYLARDSQHTDLHTTINHHRPHGTSTEYYKGVLAERARGVFNGKVWVAAGAYKTVAQQTNKNLLLANTAEINTKPQLEIYADDVQCAHGAAIGELDRAALFFLRTRGIDAVAARNLLINAFIAELLEQITVPSVRNLLDIALRNFLAMEVTQL